MICASVIVLFYVSRLYVRSAVIDGVFAAFCSVFLFFFCSVYPCIFCVAALVANKDLYIIDTFSAKKQPCSGLR